MGPHVSLVTNIDGPTHCCWQIIVMGQYEHVHLIPLMGSCGLFCTYRPFFRQAFTSPSSSLCNIMCCTTDTVPKLPTWVQSVLCAGSPSVMNYNSFPCDLGQAFAGGEAWMDLVNSNSGEPAHNLLALLLILLPFRWFSCCPPQRCHCYYCYPWDHSHTSLCRYGTGGHK